MRGSIVCSFLNRLGLHPNPTANNPKTPASPPSGPKPSTSPSTWPSCRSSPASSRRRAFSTSRSSSRCVRLFHGCGHGGLDCVRHLLTDPTPTASPVTGAGLRRRPRRALQDRLRAHRRPQGQGPSIIQASKQASEGGGRLCGVHPCPHPNSNHADLIPARTWFDVGRPGASSGWRCSTPSATRSAPSSRATCRRSVLPLKFECVVVLRLALYR